jgi:TonB family protein
MNSVSIELRPWPRSLWWMAIAFVLTFQIALVFWLSERSPRAPPRALAAPVFHLSPGESDELLALEDPTLFVLPHHEGFSGQTWLRIPAQDFHPADWSEPPCWLPLPVQQLGTSFRSFAQTNTFPPFQTVVMPPLALTVPELSPTGPFAAPSTLKIEGDLARRRLLSPLELKSWPNPDLLTNTIVQLLVDSQGNTVSATVLQPGSGKAEADQLALELARSARFEPAGPAGPHKAEHTAADLTLGTMIFEWQTLPPTNATPATP